MDLNKVLTKAIILATKLHDGQVDKAGEPYILHPLRVMSNVKSIEGKILAVLHDVKEDCNITDKELIYEGIPVYFVTKLDFLTKRKNEKYFEYIQRVKSDEHAKEVKNADLDDNMNICRLYPDVDKDRMNDIDYLKSLGYLKEKDIKRIEKYKIAKEMLAE